MTGSIHAWSAITSAFLASSVEAVEALTVVLAVGVVRGWQSAVLGTVGALALLAVLVAVFGLALASIPIEVLQLVVGTLLLLFGIRWLRKAMLRAAGVIERHDEAGIYESECRALRGDGAEGQAARAAWDPIAIVTAFKAVTLEGVEVIIIVIGVGAVQGTLAAASLGALAACLLVTGAALILRPGLRKISSARPNRRFSGEQAKSTWRPLACAANDFSSRATVPTGNCADTSTTAPSFR